MRAEDTRFDLLFRKWCFLPDGARVLVVTDDAQSALAEAIRRDFGARCQVFEFSERISNTWRSLDTGDLLIALLSIDTYLDKGANKLLSPFAKPEGLRAAYAFIRLSIDAQSLRQGLSTDRARVYAKIDEMSKFASGDTLRVTNAAGTAITLRIKRFQTLAFDASGECAFLPPSETTAEVIAHTANGEIVIDITAGQLYSYGKLLGNFGRVPSPITLIIKDGEIVDIEGAQIAAELKQKLFSLPDGCRAMVELGQGLSDMTPAGLIGIDESIISTCHFGFGDASACGTHWDAVISEPHISIEKAAVS